MKVLKRQLSPCFGKPENQFSHAVSEMSLLSNPYKVLVIPYALPLLQHIVCLLRRYRINLHAWTYETRSSMQEDLEESPNRYLPSYLFSAKIKRLQKPRKYACDEAVISEARMLLTIGLRRPAS